MSSVSGTSTAQRWLLLGLVFVVAGAIALWGLLRDKDGAVDASATTASGLNRGLVGYWRFDGDSASVVDDSEHGNDGVFVNSTRARGRYGEALDLSGDGDSHVSIPASSSLDEFTDEMTVSVWAYPHGRPKGFTVLVSRQIAAVEHPDQFYLGFGPVLGITLYKWHIATLEGGIVQDRSVYAELPGADRWIHVAGVYDGAALRLYVDGAEIGVVPLTGRIQVYSNPVTIGGEENGSDPQVVEGEFAGLIDEVRLYNRALTAAEITAIYQQPPY